MSIAHIDLLHQELPDLFHTRDLPSGWQEELILVPVVDPERVSPKKDKTAKNLGNQEEMVRAPQDDWDGLTDRGLEKIAADMVASGEPVPDFSQIIVQIFGGTHAGAPVPRPPTAPVPPPDCLAFYLPFHYYHPTWWGVYLLLDGVVWLAADIWRRSRRKITPIQAVEAARLFLYYHEAMHHKTECFATRLELTHRTPLFKTGFAQLYRTTVGTDDCLEEGLANASGLDGTWEKLHSLAVDKALSSYSDHCPPGYRLGTGFRPDFEDVRSRFAEGNQRICLPELPGKNPNVWRMSPHLFHGVATIKSHVNYVIPRNSPLASRLRF